MLKRFRSRGFSLLEMLVAFSIMAISLGILLNIFSTGVKTAVVAEDYIIATQIAESLMAKADVETPLMPGQFYGTEDDKYYWEINVVNMPEFPEFPDVKDPGFILLEVNIFVRWGEGNNERMIALNTVRAVPEP